MKLIPLTKGFSAMVDDDMFDYLNQWKWHYNCGYAERKENGKHIQMHRVVMAKQISKARHGYNFVDHKDNNSLNNQIENLRLASKSTNAMNMKKAGYKGVTKQNNQWRVQIWKNNKRVFSASAATERMAAMIYDLNAPIYFGEYARLNFSPAERIGDALP